MSRACIYCQEPLFGRSDQKFCSDFCRNQFHNQKKRSEYGYLRRINCTLKRNRNILLNLYQQSRLVVRLDELLQAGFDPNYCTACIVNQQGILIYHCYDMIYETIGSERQSLQLSRTAEYREGSTEKDDK